MVSFSRCDGKKFQFDDVTALGDTVGLHLLSIGLMSGYCFSLIIILMLSYSNHARVTLAVCFGSLSCWNIQSGTGSNFLTDDCHQSSKILIYMADFMVLPIIIGSSVPLYAKTHTNHDVTTTVIHSREGVLLTVCGSILSPNMDSIVVAKKYNFNFIRPQNLIKIVVIILQVDFSKIQS